MASKKLIFFDIDGTIVTDNGGKRIIPQSTIQAIRTLQSNGHLCFINTGRALTEIDESIRSLQMDGFVCGCGTYIAHQDTVLFHKTIPTSLGNRILKEFEICDLEWVLEGSQNLYFSELPYRTHIGDFKKEFSDVFSIAFDAVAPEDAHDLVFDKFCICAHEQSNVSRFMDSFQDDLSFIDRGNHFFEVIPTGCSKASGIRFLMDHFSIAHEDTLAIGDSTNDLPMLEYAGVSIAMGGSDPVVCQSADIVTAPILEDGLYKAFDFLHLL